jgi:molecular chaperone GrpE
MTDKKKYEEEINETKAEAVETPESSEQLSADAEREALEKQLEEAQTRVFEYKDGWMRSQAEFQNYRKRIERDNEMMYASMKGDILKKVLPVLDDLERPCKPPADSGWVSGIELIQKKLLSILESEGVRRIEAVGAAFDPNFHEAISHESIVGVQSGHVIAVVQNGYILGERVIRPALVRVAQ